MRRSLIIVASISLLLFLSIPSIASQKPNHSITSFEQYTNIPGAHAVGSKTCATCHSKITGSFPHSFHAQQGVECEQCHGDGSLHVSGGGDVTKIVNFSKRPAREANGVCLSCHAQDAKVRNWMAGPHASNGVRCIDCHNIHSNSAKGAATSAALSMDMMSPGSTRSVAELVPETQMTMGRREEINDACLRCHPTERAQMNQPYHHPLREAKMTCVDCHDPHGGYGRNNLKTANVNALCVSCHAQYRGPFTYQHPPVTENCLNCHTPHGSPNTNLLTLSEPALCLQCHAGHHNGANLPLADRCTDCHGSIHGTDVPAPTGGSVFVDKGGWGVPSIPTQTPGSQPAPGYSPTATQLAAVHGSLASGLQPVASHTPSYGITAAALGAGAAYGAPLAGSFSDGSGGMNESSTSGSYSAYSITPGMYRFTDNSGYAGRVGEYDSLEQSAGADLESAYVSTTNHMVAVSRANLISGDDYHAASQITMGGRLQAGFDVRSFVQQQDNYPFYSNVISPDIVATDLIPDHATFGVTRRLGSAHINVKVPKLPVHVFVKGNWQARSGTTQLAYFDMGGDTSCDYCHYNSQFQPVNYTNRTVGGGVDVTLKKVQVTWEHDFSSFNDRLQFPTGVYGATLMSVEPGPVPVNDTPAGNYYLDIPAPNQASSDRVNLNWTVSPQLVFNGTVGYTRSEDTFTGNPQNSFEADDSVVWHPVDRLQVTGDYHQQNLINEFTPYYNLYGNVSYHEYSAGVHLDYELTSNLDAEAYYKRGGISRSNAYLWPQVYSPDNTDLLGVVPDSSSNTTGMALRYHHGGRWSARAGYEWTGTHNPGYLIVPQSNNRMFGDVTYMPANWLTFTSDTSVIVQDAFPVIQRRNRFYVETISATLRPLSGWDVDLGYSYSQQDLNTYMAFQNDSSVGYVLDTPLIPYKQLNQSYWGETSYTLKHRAGIALEINYDSARSGLQPDLNANDYPAMADEATFQQSLWALQLGSTQVSAVLVPQWTGKSKVYYLFPHQIEGGVLFNYGSYRDYWNPNLNGVLRTASVYVGRSW